MNVPIRAPQVHLPATQHIADYSYTIRVEPDMSVVLESLSDSLLSIIGTTIADLNRDSTPYLIIYADDIAIFKQHFAHLLANRPSTCDLRVQTALGELRWLRDYALPQWDKATERVVAISGAGRDITQAKRDEEALYSSVQLYHSICDQPGLGVVVFDSNQRVLMSNAVSACMLAVMKEDLSQITWPSLCQRIGNLPKQIVADTLQQQHSYSYRIHYTSTDQHSRILDITTIPLIGAQGGCQNVLMRLVDVSERLRQEMITFQANLLELSGYLIGSIAHELNTPLQSIQSCLDLAVSASQQQRSGYLVVASEEIDRISTLLHLLLGLHGPSVREIGLVDINHLIAQMLVLVSGMLAERSIEVVHDLDADLPPIWARPDHLMLVLLNALLVAIRYVANRGQLAIRTALKSEPSSAASPQATVSISGYGIRAAVTTPSFFSDHPDGDALGEAIAHQLVALYGGQILLHSDATNTTLIVALPIDDEQKSRQRYQHGRNTYPPS